MQLQGRNLSFVEDEPMQGEDVALLHGELLQLHDVGLLDAEISADEVGSKFFGPTTYEAAVHFQEQHGLDATGIDEYTWAANPLKKQ
jgi:hypothetical protein